MKTCLTLGLGLAGLLAIASCGRSNGNGANGNGPNGDPANQGGELRLGAAIALTGNASLFGQDSRIGLDLAQRQFGSQNPKLKLVLEDAGSDEGAATVAFRRLINANVVAILGPSLSQQGFAVFPMANRAGIPAIGVSTTAEGIPQIGPYVARISAPVTEIAPRSLAKAMELHPGIKRVAVFFAQDDAFASSETKIFQRAIRAKGLNLVSVQRTSVTENDFQIASNNVLRTKPDLIVISMLQTDGGNLVRQLRELGYRGPIVAGNGLNTPNIYPVCQKHCDGLLITQAYNPSLNSPSNQSLLKLFRERQGKGSVPPQVTAQSYAGYQVVHEALGKLQATLPPGKKLNQLPLAELRSRLMGTLLAGTYQTPLGEIRFTPEGEVIQKNFSVARIRMAADGRSGRFEQLP